MRTGIILGVALVLAVFSGSMSLAKAIERQQPDSALALPGHSGFVEATVARRIIVAGRTVEGQRTLVLDPALSNTARALSLAAYRSEPMSAQALANLAFLTEADGDATTAQRLMFGAASLNSRKLDVNGWLLEYHVARQDAVKALETYDLILRSNEAARTASIPIVVQFLANAELIAPMTDLLAARPPWKTDFWNEAYKVEPALGNVAQVRINLVQTGMAVTVRNDQLLIDALVQAKQFAPAEALYTSLTGAQSDPAQLVPNGNFDRASDVTPYDWELSFETFHAASLEPSTGRLRVETFADGGGLVARNLVRLEGQSFVLGVTTTEWDELDAEALYFRIRCAEDSASQGDAARIYLGQPELSLQFRKAQPACTYHWLEIYARAQPQQRDNAILLENITISPSS